MVYAFKILAYRANIFESNMHVQTAKNIDTLKLVFLAELSIENLIQPECVHEITHLFRTVWHNFYFSL